MTTQYASLPYGMEDYAYPPPPPPQAAYGQPPPPIDFGNLDTTGELRVKRRVNDRLWVAAFLVCLFSLFGSLVANAFTGSPGNLGHLRNYQGLTCGWDSKVQHLPYLYVPLDTRGSKPLTLYSKRAMCVARCPDAVDVAARAYISVPESALLQDKQQEAYVSVLHSVRSPLYATKQTGDILCLPEHPVLLEEMKKVVDELHEGSFRLIAAGVHRALPLFIGLTVTAAIFSYCLFGATLPIPGSVTAVMLITSITMMTVCGCKLIWRGIAVDDPHNSATIGSVEPPQALVFAGCLMLLLAVATIVHTLTNLRNLSNASLVAHALAQCSGRFATGSGIYPLIQLMMFFVGLVGTVASLLLASKYTAEAGPASAALDPNGGINITSLERTIYRPPGSLFQLALMVAITIWAMESILTLTKFVSSFTTTHRYFNHSRQRPETLLREPVHAILTAYQYCLGSLSLYAILRCLTRPIRIATMTTSATRYDRDIQSTQQRINDHIQNAVFSELVLTGHGVRKALLASATRLATTPYEAPAASVGVVSLLAWTHGMLIFMGTFAMASSFLHSVQDGGTAFMGSPTISALAIATVATYVASVPWAAMETSADTVLYSALLETESPPTMDYVPDPRVPRTASMSCPLPFVRVIDEIGQQMASN